MFQGIFGRQEEGPQQQQDGGQQPIPQQQQEQQEQHEQGVEREEEVEELIPIRGASSVEAEGAFADASAVSAADHTTTASTTSTTRSSHAPPFKKQRATSTPVKHPKPFSAPLRHTPYPIKDSAGKTLSSSKTPNTASTLGKSGSIGNRKSSQYSGGSVGSGSGTAGGSSSGLGTSPRFMQATKASNSYQQDLTSPTSSSKAGKSPNQSQLTLYSPATSAVIEMEVNEAIQRRKMELKRLKERAALGIQSNGTPGGSVHGLPNLQPQSRYAQYNVGVPKNASGMAGSSNGGTNSRVGFRSGATSSSQQQQHQAVTTAPGRVRMTGTTGAVSGVPSPGMKVPSPGGLGVPMRRPPGIRPNVPQVGASKRPASAPVGSGASASVSFAAPPAPLDSSAPQGNGVGGYIHENNHTQQGQHHVSFQQPASAATTTTTAAVHTPPMPNNHGSYPVEVAMSGAADISSFSTDTPVRPRHLDLNTTQKPSSAAGHTPFVKAAAGTAGHTPFAKGSPPYQSPPLTQTKAPPGHGVSPSPAVNHEASTPMTANRARSRDQRNGAPILDHAAATPPDAALQRGSKELKQNAAQPPLLPSADTLGQPFSSNGGYSNGPSEKQAPILQPTNKTSSDLTGSVTKKEEMFRTMMDYASDAAEATTDAAFLATAGSTQIRDKKNGNEHSDMGVARPTSATLRKMAEVARLKKIAEEQKKNGAVEKEQHARGDIKSAEVATSAFGILDDEEEVEDTKATQTTPRLFADDDEEEDDEDAIQGLNEKQHGNGSTFMGGFGDLVSPVKPVRSAKRGSASLRRNNERGGVGEFDGKSPPSPILEEEHAQFIRSPEQPQQFLPFIEKAIAQATRQYSSPSNILYIGFISPHRLLARNENEMPGEGDTPKFPLLFNKEAEFGAEDTFTTRLTRDEQLQFMQAIVQSTSSDMEEKMEAQTILESFMCVQAHMLFDKKVYLTGRLPYFPAASSKTGSKNKWKIQMQHYQPLSVQGGDDLRLHKVDTLDSTLSPESLCVKLGNVVYIDAFGMEQEYNLGRLYGECAHAQQLFLTCVLTTAWNAQENASAKEAEHHSRPDHREQPRGRPVGSPSNSREGGITAPIVMGQKGAQGKERQVQARESDLVEETDEIVRPPQFSPLTSKEGRRKIQEQRQKRQTFKEPPSDTPVKQNPEVTQQPRMGHEDDDPAMDTSSALIMLIGMVLNGLFRLTVLLFVKLPLKIFWNTVKISFAVLLLSILWKLVRDDNGLHTMERMWQHNYATPANAQWPRIPLLRMLWDFMGIPGQNELGRDQDNGGIM